MMQRGIRMNPHSTELYFQYIRLELLYMLKLRERRRIMDSNAQAGILKIDGQDAPAAQSSDECVSVGCPHSVVLSNHVAAETQTATRAATPPSAQRAGASATSRPKPPWSAATSSRAPSR
jgi:hypothetical protein